MDMAFNSTTIGKYDEDLAINNDSNSSYYYMDYMDEGLERTNLRWFVYNLDFYIVPIIIVIGLIGNTLSFCVFILTHLKILSSSIYLAALAISDNGFLLCVFFGWLVNVNFNFYQHQGLCQLFVYMTYVFGFLSVWYVVGFTIERYIVVCFPLRRSLCTRGKAKIVVIILAVVAALLYCPILWTSTVDTSSEDPEEHMCHPIAGYENYVQINSYIDTVITLIIPSALIIVMNLLIVHQVIKTQNMQRELTSTGSVSDARSLNSNRSSTTRRLDQSGQITKLLLVVSSIFLLLNLPNHAIRLHVLIAHIFKTGMLLSINYQQWKIIFQIIYYINFSINILLYNVCGKNFREALKGLFRCGKRRYGTSAQSFQDRYQMNSRSVTPHRDLKVLDTEESRFS